MRFTISREKLQEGLAMVAASIPSKTTLPVLANILIETTDKGIRLSGTDLDIAVSTEVLADVDPSRIHDLHIVQSGVVLQAHLDLFERGIARKLDFSYSGPQGAGIARALVC